MNAMSDHGLPKIEWVEHPRIAPGIYRAYSAVARVYFDPGYRRWVCFIRWDVLSACLTNVIARAPLWWTLGKDAKPRAKRRGKYLAEWVRANGKPPLRGDRLSPNVFRHRMAKVEIADTDPQKSPAPYSVVRKILEWETGPSPGHSVNKSHSQGRHRLNGAEAEGCEE
jgi:hypothetical protein